MSATSAVDDRFVCSNLPVLVYVEFHQAYTSTPSWHSARTKTRPSWVVFPAAQLLYGVIFVVFIFGAICSGREHFQS